MRRRGVGRRSREACFYTGVAGGAGPAEVRAGEGKRSDWTREAAGSAVRRRPWRRARPGPALIGEVGRALTLSRVAQNLLHSCWITLRRFEMDTHPHVLTTPSVSK